jgi:hypothetical protein
LGGGRWGPSWWSRTPTLDGYISDWLPTETFLTNQGGGALNYVTWDADNLYVASKHPDVAAGTALHWLIIYVGNGSRGNAAGLTHNTQQPGLPFGATHMIRWKANNSYNSLETADGLGGWSGTPGWLGTVGAVAERNDQSVVELRIPRAALGLDDGVVLHISWQYEGAAFESTYGGTPASSFLNATYDPDFSSALVFDFESGQSPLGQAP